MKTWVNLHQHGVYSFLDGHSRYDALMERAGQLGMPALGITEHGNVHGWPDFYEIAKAHDVKPILGAELYQARKTRHDRDEEERAGRAVDEFAQRGPHHLTLLARNYEGYKNIIKISSRAYLEGFYGKPRLDFELLDNHSEGLIVLSGCLSGAVQQALLRQDTKHAEETARQFQEIVGPENFFIEIMDHKIEEELRVRKPLVELANKIGAKIIPTGDCHYTHSEDYPSHDLMLCVSTNAVISSEDRFKFSQNEFYLKSYDEMEQLFPGYAPGQWLKNTLVLADQIELELKVGELHFPEYPLPPERELNEFLDDLVWEGLTRRYGVPLPGDVKARAEHELGVVRREGFQSYFLVVWDLVKWAKDQGIRVGYGRGSAAGSILSYALGITNLDPLRFGLLFERFLIEGRKEPPDIDLDFDDRYRDLVIDYARGKYGTDHVAQICTFNRIGARQAIRDTARVLGYDYLTGDRIAKLIPPHILGVSKGLEESLATKDLFDAYRNNEDARTIIDGAKGLEGVLRQPGIHPAGIVISQRPIIEYVPVMQKGEKKPVVIQWDLERVAENGLLKIDFLGLRNLGVVEDTIQRIKALTGEDIDVDALPTDDFLTFDELASGHTIGVFQMESPGLQQMTAALQPTSIEDLMALISLYRPGPMGSGVDKVFIARQHGREKTTYATPKLAEVLHKTHGIMLYQEDVLKVATHLAGFSNAEADDLRKAMGKKLMDKIGKYRKSFVQRCQEHSEISAPIAEKIYSDIEFFAGYGFGMAHAASYAMLAYLTAYLKVHYPGPYMAALLSSVVDKRDKMAIYLAECRRMGVVVHPPDIAQSDGDFKVVNNKEIFFGLLGIEGVGPAVAKAVVSTRPKEGYVSYYDFLRKCDPAKIATSSIVHLVKAGAFDNLLEIQPKGTLNRKQKMEILDLEKEELGVYVTDHPILDVQHLLEPHTTHSITELETVSAGELVTIAGLLTQADHRSTRKGQKMARFHLEDLMKSVEVTVFPGTYHKVKWLIKDGNILIVKGKVEKEGDDQQYAKVIAFDIREADLPLTGTGIPIVVEFTQDPDYNIIASIEQIIEDMPGDSPVYLSFQVEVNKMIKVQLKKPTSLEAKPLIEKLVGMGSIL